MKTNQVPSSSDVAFRVRELIEEHAPRFVAVVALDTRYGVGQTSFAALCDAIGEAGANALVADMQRDSATYTFDEVFGRDVWRAWHKDSGELIALIVRG